MKKYDVALSFAGEDRKHARELAEHLKERRIKVFFDEFEESHLWGQNLYSHLSDIYQNRCQYVVIFVSAAYAKKLWTKVEREAAQAKAFSEPDPYILPIRLDDTQVQGILPTVGYVDWFAKGSAAIADMILERLGRAINHKDGAEMIRIPEGQFKMGSTQKPDDRTPERIVRLDTYYIYKYPVTVAQFKSFCEDAKYSWNFWTCFECEPQDEHPMVCVDWADAAAYADWAGVKLPTEAQWEKAARGVEGLRFPWGNSWEPGWCMDQRFQYGTAGWPVEIGTFPRGASPYGVEDMCGNIWEWCADWYDPGYYRSAVAENPRGPEQGTSRVKRGCGWKDDINFPVNFESSFRYHQEPGFKYRLDGFRCVREI